MKSLKACKIHRILVISLTNIGDVVLTLPVVDILKRDFPDAKLSIIVGPKAETLLKENPIYEKVHIYNKHQPPITTFKWILNLRKENYDLVVDLRNTAIPFMLSVKYHTPLHMGKKEAIHMKIKHLKRLKTIHPYEKEEAQRVGLYVSAEGKRFIDACLSDCCPPTIKFIVMAPGAADEAKRWSKQGFAQVADFFWQNNQLKTIFIGNESDLPVVRAIQQLMEHESINLCGKTDLMQSVEIIRRCQFAIVNDSAALHMASYLDKPVVALFGYSDPIKYGPWASDSIYLTSKDSILKENSSKQEKMDYIEGIDALDVIRSISIEGEQILLKKL